MLDLARLRDDPEGVRKALARKGAQHAKALEPLLEADTRRRGALGRLEALRHEKRTISESFAKADPAAKEAARAKSKSLDEEIKHLEEAVRGIDEEIETQALILPNTPHAQVPDGTDAAGNVEVRQWGKKPAFAFAPKAHWDLGEALGILDNARGVKIAGSGFPLYTGWGARLERALLNFMLDLHVKEQAYIEVFPPFLANRDTMRTTGQVPKFEEDMYRLEKDGLYLIPTAEAPLTSIHRDEILDEASLPKRYTAYSACFRRESGAAGKDTRGIQRVHQFNKTELMTYAHPDKSYEELERLTNDAEEVLKRLGLHYRVVRLCAGDMGFSAAMTYDLEVWAPGVGRYLEVSSCSNFEDFQARRGAIRFKDGGKGKPRLVHTLNGSGTATPRLFIALTETHQQADGSILIPEPLRPYLGTDRITP